MKLLRHLSAGTCSLAAAAAASAATEVLGLTAQQGLAFLPHPSRQPLPRGKCYQFSSSTTRSLRCGSSAPSDRAEEWREAVLPFLPPDHCRTASPAESLGRGEWFKLICGASFEDLPAIRDLSLVYTLAGADCIDVAAEEAVIEAARDGVIAALGVAEAIGKPMRMPWLMMSVNDDEEDPHFRKAAFDPNLCPADCPRPCEAVCPADAVVFPDSAPPPAQRAAMVGELLRASAGGGVLGPRCYGCGRCITVCPPGIIRAEKYKRSPGVVRELLEKVDGVEIHTKGNLASFRELWEECVAAAASRPRFRVVAVSFPDLGDDTGLAVATMGAVMDSGPGREGRGGAGEGSEATSAQKRGTEFEVAGEQKLGGRALNVWQTDGRPMSGDIGTGATAACIRLAEKVLDTRALPFGEGQHFVQLAGGTNDRTAHRLREMGLVGHDYDGVGVGDGDGDSSDCRSQDRSQDHHRRQQQPPPPWQERGRRVGGVAYGGYARKAVGRALDRLPGKGAGRVEDHPEVLSAALREASLLVGGLKQP